MNDIVITYKEKEGSEDKLRQILRKIENEFEGFNEVVIVGDLPEWVQGCASIRYRFHDEKKWEMKNKLKMLHYACEESFVTLNFLWVDQDDILTRINAAKPCRIKADSRPKGYDQVTLAHTVAMLERRGFHEEVYLSKYPISFNKLNLIKILDLIDFETPYGYDIKTLYVNFNRLKECKQSEPLENEHYVNKSSYEK